MGKKVLSLCEEAFAVKIPGPVESAGAFCTKTIVDAVCFSPAVTTFIQCCQWCSELYRQPSVQECDSHS